MLDYNEIKPKKYIVFDDEPYEVLESHVFRKQQRKPVNQTKLRNLKTGKVVEKSFHQSESVHEADLDRKKVVFLFKKPNRQSSAVEYWFSEEINPKERFMLKEEKLGVNPLFLKEKEILQVILFEEEVLSIELPIKLKLLVTEAPPAIKGNTATGGTKQITLETGAIVSAPLFINEGDFIIVNTETGEYVERAK